MMIQLANDGKFPAALSYTSGNPGNALFITQLSVKPSEEWVIVGRDLYTDMLFAQMNHDYNHNLFIHNLIITGIALNPWDSECAWFDSIILVSSEEELVRIAKTIQEKHPGKVSEYPVLKIKDRFVAYNTKNGEWEKTVKQFAQIEKSLDDEDRKFLSVDVAFAYAWLGLEQFGLGEYQKALAHLNLCEKYLKLAGLSNKKWNFDLLKDLVLKRVELGEIQAEYSQRIGIVQVKNLDVSGFKLSSDVGDKRRFEVEWGIIKRFFEVYSGGKVSLKINFNSVDGTIQSLTKKDPITPDFGSTKPYPYELMFKLAKSSDVIVLYNTSVMASFGGLNMIGVIPEKNVYSPRRGLLSLSKSLYNPDDFMLPLHEYVHNLEFFFGLKTAHIFRTAPEFAKEPVKTELAYYESLFEKIIPEIIENNKSLRTRLGWKVFGWANDKPFNMSESEFQKILKTVK